MSSFPGVGVMIAGDLNQLNLDDFILHLGFSKLVKKPTRGKNILDKFLTNIPWNFSKVVCSKSSAVSNFVTRN